MLPFLLLPTSGMTFSLMETGNAQSQSQVLSQLGMRPTGGGSPAGAAAGGLAVPGTGWAVPPAGGAGGNGTHKDVEPQLQLDLPTLL